ncbi:MAG: hypothetical protein IJN09_01650 [Oscillospiraceae bacterium]|nr:hypothetical protein [Oscillospiraceae bacterium]
MGINYSEITVKASSAKRSFAISRSLRDERVRYSVYEGGKIYLLNTDYDVPAVVKVISKGEEKTIILEPLELKVI